MIAFHTDNTSKNTPLSAVVKWGLHSTWKSPLEWQQECQRSYYCIPTWYITTWSQVAATQKVPLSVALGFNLATASCTGNRVSVQGSLPAAKKTAAVCMLVLILIHPVYNPKCSMYWRDHHVIYVYRLAESCQGISFHGSTSFCKD